MQNYQVLQRAMEQPYRGRSHLGECRIPPSAPSRLHFTVVRVCATVRCPYWDLSSSFKSQDEIFVRGEGCNTPSFHYSLKCVIYSASSCNSSGSLEMGLGLVEFKFKHSFHFLSNQVQGELVWKLQNFSYNHAI
jgi:hypothetical protein